MKNGPYELIIAPENFPGKKYRGRYCYEHTLIWWKHKELPKKGYEIHHINGNHRDNRIDNLKLLTIKEHRDLHSKDRQKKLVEFYCAFCNKQSKTKPCNYRYRLKNNRYGKLFCSRKCGTLYHFNNVDF